MKITVLKNNWFVQLNMPKLYALKMLAALSFFILLNSAAFAQTIVKGIVYDTDKIPMVGATIQVAGTNTRTQTDAEGKYSISVPSSSAKLIFSFVGYQSQTVSVNNQGIVTVTLQTTNNLEGVTVVGYASVKKNDLTGATTTISAKDFNKGPLTSPDQLLQGKVAGVQMTNNSGQPGGASTVRVRGNSAITGTGQPLYVVDGVALDNRSARPSTNNGVGGLSSSPTTGDTPDGNPLNFINPADIESMEILKDASATAIYGSRAAYGVVLITTKRGKSGDTKIDVGASAGISNIARQIDILNADEYRTTLKQYGLTYGDFGNSINAMDAITQTGYNQNYSVGISGGTNGNTYRASVGYQDQKGIIKTSNFKKYSAGFNGNFKFLESKKLGLDINMLSSQYLEDIAPISTTSGFQGSLISQALAWNPTEPLYNTDGSLHLIKGSSQINPLVSLEANSDKAKVSTILGSISPYYKITPWLEYRMLASVNYSTGIRRSSTRSFLNLVGIEGSGYGSYANTELTTKQFTNTLNFNKEIANKLNLNAIIGYEYTSYGNKGLINTATGFGTAIPTFVDYTDIFQATDPANRTSQAFNDPTYELQSYFARAIFNYDSKYILTATFRSDGSTRFGANNKYGYFPSFAAAWNIKNEKFLSDATWLNQLKLRLGWGITGNQDFPSGSSQQRYNYGFNSGAQSTTFINNANPDLKWQSDKQTNIGIDFGFWDSKITGSIDYFNKTTTDLLFPLIPFQPAFAGVPVWTNLPGEIINKGFELSVNANIISKDDWSWTLGGNATFIKNKVQNLSPAVGIINTGSLSGGGLSGVTAEVIQNGLPLFAMVTKRFTGLDANGFSTYENNGALYYSGNPNPKVLLGVSTNVGYKKFSFTANFNGAFGHDIYNNTANSVLPINNLGTRNIASNLINQGSVKENIANSTSASSRYIEKGNYLKLANATINYSIGNIGKSIKALNVYVNGQNLFVITKYTGFDPEVNTSKSVNGVPSAGIDYIGYPTARTFNLGVNFSL
ncbi:SusC/RagA family TonB-linked outer membrane protein [Pedobacter punctiformis]|uniref:SusC/RagA family TonB-linked outer membrane protein n=1 Tax=Pedobacter punctiformis TaxID=3004097 RepID=A0ABT4LE86_9SPHI|nr:SusC/RagA family TonB-linked outer membrane protein [Pedobacter sp. HCMS5-2]MCZ4245159.1 SusC/RagA family TonB-linked outer membrane protein [Pedobacter sp. HCMS5-2]